MSGLSSRGSTRTGVLYTSDNNVPVRTSLGAPAPANTPSFNKNTKSAICAVRFKSEGVDFFDDENWDRWIPENLIALVPGAIDFLKYCEYHGVEIFYVTNRDQGPRTYSYALNQLQYLNLPYSDSEHLVVFRESSDKTSARERIGESHELILLLGDNLNDFKRDYYVADVEERRALMERDRAEIGDKFIILPNATDGHWVRAIFGESEPAATDENRLKLLAAATRGAWIGARSTQG